MAPFPQDATISCSPSSFTLPLRPRNRDSDDSGRHMQTLIQQISNLKIDDYQSPQGDHHRQEQRFVQTTTTMTTTNTALMTNQPHDGDARLLPNSASSSHFSSTISPRPAAIHDCSSNSCSDFFNTAASTATARQRHSKLTPSSVSISEVSSGFGTGGESPSSNRYLRTRRGAISGPTCPGPAFSPVSTRSDARAMDPRAPPSGQQRLLLSAPGARSVISSDVTARRADSTTTAFSNRLNEVRLLPSPSNGWIDHDRNSVVSSNSRSTVRPPSGYTAPPPSSASSRASASRSSHHPRPVTREITPNDSISQVGPSALASVPPTAWRAERKQPSLSLPTRSLPLRGVRHVSVSEVGSRLSPHVRPQQQEDSWILPWSTPGRFRPPPPSEFEAASSRSASRREFY